MKCFICKNEINKSDGNHVYRCADKNKINYSKKDIKFLNYKFNFPELLTTREEFKNLYENNSITDFNKKFGLNSYGLFYILDYWNIKKRSISEGQKKIGLNKAKKSNLKKYGKENVLSKGTKFYYKRNKTVKEKYGVSNVFQLKEVIEKCNTKEAHIKTSIGWKKWYYSLSKKEKKIFLENSIHSDIGKDNAIKSVKGYNKSGLEEKISKILNMLDLTYTRQFKLKPNKKRRYYYDFFIEKYNLIIEINGDYWHANPTQYKENDKINYIYGVRTAKDVWERDKQKNDFAVSKDYDLIVIWENEIKNKTTDELVELLNFKLNKYEENKNKINKENSTQF